MTDVVVTFVDGRDPEWRRAYAESLGVPTLEKRYRDWGLLKYLLRGIQCNMPFVGNVHLVVSSPSQVPQWVDREKIHIVCHKDIIPEEYLPTFNSTTIEMFLHNIEGLAEQFIYFNDDMFAMLPVGEEYFYDKGKINIGFAKHCIASGIFRYTCRNSDRLARKVAGMGRGVQYVRPQHCPSPMLKSRCKEAFEAAQYEICTTLTPIRTKGNLCQYFFLDYLYYKNLATGKRFERRHFSLAVHKGSKIAEWLRNPDVPIACINDVEMSQSQYEDYRAELLAAFEERFPQKSVFELPDSE